MRRILVLTACIAWNACGSSARLPAPVATPDAAQEPTRAPEPSAEPDPSDTDPALASWHFLRKKYDRDGDARITRSEYSRSDAGFARLDADQDGLVSVADFDAKWDGVPRVKTFEYGVGGPEVGEPAPEFELSTTEGKSVSLAALRAERPVALVFGSFT